LFAFIISRVLQALPVMLTVALISFAMFAYVGDPVAIMLGQDFTEAQRQALVNDLGLDKPFWVQFGTFIGNAVQGEFGLSYRLSRPVADLIAERAPATLELAFCAASVALLIGVPMGVYTGLYRNSWLSRFFLTFSLIGVSLPVFLIGILLILVFAVWLGVLPSFGRGDTVKLGWWSTGFLTWSGLKALVLPSITLGLFQLTLIMRLVRAEMLEVLRTDYIKFARARGLPNRGRSGRMRHVQWNS
jgi:peptide/nickel transport system permease protein